MDSTSKRLVGRRAIVTGGGSGIGQAVAMRLSQEGAAVGVVDVREGSAEAVATAIRQAGGAAIGIVANVRDEAAVSSAVQAAAEAFGGLDTVVVCAGMVYSGATHTLTREAWDTVMGVNVTGAFLTVKHALPHLMAADGGAIVTIGSVASVVAAADCCAYDASKGALLQFTRSIAVEYVDKDIRANCVLPGAVTTGLSANSLQIGAIAASAEGRPPSAERTKAPMSRRADPGEIAAAVAFLCSNDASFITGAAIPVDGGYTMV